MNGEVAMVFKSVFAHNSLIGTAMGASVLKNEVISNNIANAEVPGFKKSVVEFEGVLDEEIQNARKTGKINMKKLKPSVRKANTDFSYRIDGNNVDIEVEMAELYKNSVKYEVMTTSLINNYKRINMVLSNS